MDAESIKLALGVCLTLFTAVGIFYWSSTLRCLKDHHRAEWERLGSPGGLIDLGPSQSWAMTMFFMRGKHRALANPELNRRARLALGFASVCSVLVVAIFWIDWA